MVVQLSTKDKIKDIVVIFASGVATFFSGMSLVLISTYFRQITLINQAVAATPSLAEEQREPLMAAWCCVAVSMLFVVIGLFNLMYMWRYMRNQQPRSVVGYVSTFGAVLMTLALMVGYIVAHGGAKVSYVPILVETNAAFGSGMFIYFIILFVLALATQIANVIIMFVWEDPSADKIVNITQTTPGAIMLDQEDLKSEKKTPPMLNANPNAPVQLGGHNIKK